eukprot:GHVU01143907.1.p1 GENE.GHVU01143907.1~~GHVU01143907.1.p1  ORF type:complete len:285 (+),score=66.23 GHVU01143907.1:1-855(+)
MELTDAVALQLYKDVVAEAICREIVVAINAELRARHSRDSAEIGLYANPSTYPGLNNISADQMAALMREGAVVIPMYMGNDVRKSSLFECEHIDFDGRLADAGNYGRHQLRTDRNAWFAPSDLERDHNLGLLALMERMKLLPFELNAKAPLLLQAAATFFISCFPNTDAFLCKHSEGGFDAESDCGRTIAAVYFPNDPDWKEEDGGALKLYKSIDREGGEESKEDGGTADTDTLFMETLPAADILVLYRCRLVSVEVERCKRKRFSVTLWLNGPLGPGERSMNE